MKAQWRLVHRGYGLLRGVTIDKDPCRPRRLLPGRREEVGDHGRDGAGRGIRLFWIQHAN